MTHDPTATGRPGWYRRHRVHGRNFGARLHFFSSVRSETDQFGRRLSIAATDSACKRIKAETRVDFESDRADHPANCSSCKKALDAA